MPNCVSTGKAADIPQYWSNSGLVLVHYGIALHCIAPSRSKGPQGSSGSHKHVTSPLSRMLAILTTPPGIPVPAVTTDVRPAFTSWASNYSPLTESEMEQGVCVKLAGSFV